MPDAKAQLVISVRDEYSAGMKAAAQSTQAVTGGFSSMQAAIVTLNQGMQLADQIAGKLTETYNATVGAAVEWGRTVEQVAAVSGTSTEAASRMAVVFGDFGMQADSMNLAIKTLTKEGLQFNLQTLEDLAVKYQAIQDPVAKDQFLFTNFGRSGLQLAEMLSQPVDKLQAMAAQADTTGKVLSGPAAQGLVDYGIKSKQLGDQLDGLKIQLGEVAVAASDKTGFVQGITDRVEVINLLRQAMDAHKLSTGEAANVIFQWLTKIQSGGPTVQFLSDKLGINTTRVVSNTDALRDHDAYVDRFTVGFASAADAAAAAADGLRAETYAVRNSSDAIRDHVAQANGLIAAAEGFKAERAAIQNNTDAIRDHTAGLVDLITKQQEANDKSAVAAGIAGTLTKAEDTYSQVLAADKPKISDLKDQIQALTDAQGAQVTITKIGTVTADQYALQQDKVALAEKAVTDYHGKNAMQLLALKVAYEQAQASLDSMSTKMGSQTTLTEDNTKKLHALTDQLFGLQLAEIKAKDAADLTTKSFLYQQVASHLTADEQRDLAHSLGIMDDKTYNAAKAVEGYTKDLNDGKITRDQFNADMQIMADKLNGIPPIVDKIPAELKPATDAFDAQARKAQGAADALKHYGDEQAGLHDKTVTTTINNNIDTYYHNHGAPPGAGQQYAGGADFVIPPGYHENFPIGPGGGASSGERVTVTPNGGAGGGDVAKLLKQMMALQVSMPHQIARAVRDALHTR